MKKSLPLIALGVFAMVILIAQDGVKLAYAVSVVTITLPAGSATIDVTYSGSEGGTDTTAYIIGALAGQAYVWKKSPTTNTIIGNVTVTGSSAGRAIEYNPDNTFVYAVTNDKFWRISTALGLAGSFATGTANVVRDLIYDNTHNILYFCSNDLIGTVNISTLVITTVYTDGGTNGILDCAIDEENNFMYLSGDNIGGVNADLIKVSLDTFTVVDSVAIAPDFFYGVCYDNGENKVWGVESSNARIRKYDTSLNQEALVTVGTTPRFCSISTDEGARRLYVGNEGTDNVSIVDIDANVVLATNSVCNVAGTQLDTIRLQNVTNTYVTCSTNTNSIVIDNTVSEFQAPEVTNGNAVDGRCGVGTVLDCIGDRSVGLAVTGGQDITTVSGNLFCGIGFNTTCAGDVKENGTGILLMLITGTFFSCIVIGTIATANTRFGAGISYTEIPKELWLFLVVAVVALAFYFEWIPDILFYGLMVGLAGLFSFGLYKHIRG